MALWLVRAGRHGEHEARFFGDNRIYLTWGALASDDQHDLPNKHAVRKLLEQQLDGSSPAKIANNTGQISAFLFEMKPDDLVVVPRKGKSAIAVGKVTGACAFDRAGESLYRYYRSVQWFNPDVPRGAFDQDLLFSFGAIMTICEIKRNDAEKRVRAMIAGNFRHSSGAGALPKVTADDDSARALDLEQLSKDQIAKVIGQKFRGHDMARLVEAILKAQGYTTYQSPPGPDKGVDILAAPGPLGFGRPRICVQVKSQDSPVDSPTLNQLIGAMQNVQADQGLLVAWGGFKSSVDREVAAQFFRVRLWDQDELIGQLLTNYEKLDEDLRAELPLKRVWMLAAQDEGDDE
jgi:restriction system protein